MNDLALYKQIQVLPEDFKNEIIGIIEKFFLSKKEQSPKNERIFGISKGGIKISDDFDEPLEDFKEYM